MKRFVFALGLAFVLGVNASEFKIDTAHSSIEFKVKHLLVSNVGGSFKKFDGKIDLDPQDKRINFMEGEIEVASINTDNQKRDEHLKSPDFFNASKNPKAHFKMTKHDGDKLYGILTLNGISKEIELDLQMSDMIVHPKTKKDVIALELEGKINRKDFGIGVSTPSSVVGDEVKMIINFEMLGQ